MATKIGVSKKTCPICGKEKSVATGFYKTQSPLFSLEGCVPVCISCVKNYIVNEDGTISSKKMKTMLQRLDKPYYMDDLQSSYDQYKREHSYLADEEIAKQGKEIIGLYFKNINSLRQTKNKSYSDSEKDGFIHVNSNTPTDDKQKIIKAFGDEESIESVITTTGDVQWTDKDKQNRDYSIDIVGYDPFEDYPDDDRKFLFNQLAPYLDDEDSADDPYKISQILQIVNNNRQIHICDKRITNLDPIKNAADIKTLNAIKKDLVTSNDKIAKENEISVKNRSNKDVGKSTLTYLMRDLRERSFDRAEADYYDQLRGDGTQWAISISQKAMLDHCLFDENDKKEVYESQINLINQLYTELDDKKEQIRLLLLKVDKLNSLLAENGILVNGDML
ncbi:hypothetical protein [Clostridium sp. HBUAS56010]|uniref:hypothetical protein n=1 Tax=Clostridium sp. HBUAS56010 TaxID=2571127 RepID=UPI001FAA0A6D|nr:hypothetical protein [Clostridium sp. HBUAS56010]